MSERQKADIAEDCSIIELNNQCLEYVERCCYIGDTTRALGVQLTMLQQVSVENGGRSKLGDLIFAHSVMLCGCETWKVKEDDFTRPEKYKR